MSLFVASINSGSNGNCYYIGNEEDAVLIDAGISCREIEIRMKSLGLNMDLVRAVFISHEHSDHIKGLAVLSRKHKLPVYINEATRREARLKLDRSLVVDFEHEKPIKVGSLSVTPFSKHHDAVDPYSFTISYQKTNVGVFTDIGTACKDLAKHFRKCHAAFLESNYDEEMLENGNYPFILKRRIRGGKGHLSNREALELFLAHKPAHMTHLFLSHLSKNNNKPELVEQLFNLHAGSVQIIVTSRYTASALYKIGDELKNSTAPKKIKKIITQLKLQFG
ncbi:MAG TPA: MBL fold metallo-hydrolase [Chitinophagaceae bacterium]|nr:MBL fold metallo-hydrolase [Chitinophagaceae bacterium]